MITRALAAAMLATLSVTAVSAEITWRFNNN